MTMVDVIQGIAVSGKANQTNTINDYKDEEGFLCCGVCRQRKETICSEAFFQGRKLPILCKCDIERERIEAERKQKERIRFRKDRCFSHERQKKYTFENDNGKQPKIKRCKEYVLKWPEMRDKSIGLLLYGNVGCGKSYCACAIANAVCELDASVKFVNCSEVLNDLQCNPDRNGYIRSLTENALLVIDDFGIERDSKYAMEQIYNLIDNRIRSGKPLIVTTNLTLEELKNPSDTEHQRIYDRLLTMCVPIRFEGDSLRSEQKKQKRETLAEIFSRS